MIMDMIMEKRKAVVRLSGYANHSLSCSHDKQHHELNDKTLNDRLYHLWTGQLLGMHISKRLLREQKLKQTTTKKLVLSILGDTRGNAAYLRKGQLTVVQLPC